MKRFATYLLLLITFVIMTGCNDGHVHLVRNVYVSPTGEVVASTGGSPVGLTRRFYALPDGGGVPVTGNYYGDYYYNWGYNNVVDWYPTPTYNANYNTAAYCHPAPVRDGGDQN